MKLATLGLAIVSMSFLACAAPPEESTPLASGDSSLVVGAIRSTTECELRYVYKDCAETICQRFVGDFSVTSDTFPAIDERPLGTNNDPYTASIYAAPQQTPSGDSTTDGYFVLTVIEKRTGARFTSSSGVSLSGLQPNADLLGGDLRLDREFEDHGGQYDYVEASCYLHTPTPN
jgi:hypothetical protein